MSQVLSGETFVRGWSLSFADLAFVNAQPGSVRLGLAAQLKFFELNGFFVTSPSELPGEALNYLAEQLCVGELDLAGHDSSGRTGRRHCADVLRYLGFSRLTRADLEAVSAWMSSELCPCGAPPGAMIDDVFLWCRDRKIFTPSRKIIERLVRSERQKFLDGYLASVTDRLSPETITLLEASQMDPEGLTGFQKLKDDAGQATVENMLAVTERLAFIQKRDLPRALLRVPGQAWIDQSVRRVGGEKGSEMHRHGRLRQLGLYAVCLMAREAQLIDAVADLLVGTIHMIGTRSRRKVVARIAREIEKVYGKERLLERRAPNENRKWIPFWAEV